VQFWSRSRKLWKIRDGCCWDLIAHMKNDDKQPSNGADAFDVVVIAAAGGYPGCDRAAQNKLSVACYR